MKNEEQELEDHNHDTNTQDQSTPEAEVEAVETADELSIAKNDLALAQDKYLRLLAEFENYKRRTHQEKIMQIKTAGKDVIVAMLPVLDDFERALESMRKTEDISSISEGIDLIYKKLSTTLTKQGLTPLQAEGEEFDMDLHEAISNMPAPTEAQKNKVLVVVEKGYKLNDQLIRFAKVIIGN